jgi:polyisoprenoid-binding protein YceI
VTPRLTTRKGAAGCGRRGAPLALTLLLAIAPAAGAEPYHLVLDPTLTEISFTLGARLHTVRGRFALASGEVRFDPETGAATGEIRVDARSGDTGIARRDRVMHEEVLDSAAHPLLVLRPERLEVTKREADALAGRLFGSFEVRGARHPLTLDFDGTRSGERAKVSARFEVPWVAWGLPDPSNLLLSVDKTLAVEVSAGGTLAVESRGAAQAARAGRRAARPRSPRRSPPRSSRDSSTARRRARGSRARARGPR